MLSCVKDDHAWYVEIAAIVPRDKSVEATPRVGVTNHNIIRWNTDYD